MAKTDRFEVGETLIHKNPKVGIASPATFRGYAGPGESVVILDGWQMTVPTAHLTREAPDA